MAAIKVEHLYFIAILPPDPVCNEVLRLKHYFKDQYQSKAALNSPPHITLHMPFKWKEEKENILIEKLVQFTAGKRSIPIKLDNFSTFPPRVLFIQVVKNEQLEMFQKDLKRFCKTELNLFNADYKEFAYHPHITLAFRDLKKPQFFSAWEEFKEKKFESTFYVNSLALLKHDEKEWRILKEISF